MIRSLALGAIFVVNILYVQCNNAVNYNEEKKFYVPSAPQNLTVNHVTSNEIHMSWSPPTTFTLLAFPVTSFMNSVSSKVQDESEQMDASTSHIENETKMEADILSNNKNEESVSLMHAENPQNLLDKRHLSTEKFDKGISNFDKYGSSVRDFYKNDQLQYHDDVSLSDMIIENSESTVKGKREVRYSLHRHRKRRQETPIPNTAMNSEETQGLSKDSLESKPDRNEENTPIEVVKKSLPPNILPKDATQIAYVLYYEKGIPRSNTTTVLGRPNSEEVKNTNIFMSDMRMADYSSATKNLTLLNTAGLLSKVVGFRLKGLSSFTPYKIWVRAFYNFSLERVTTSSDLLQRLGPRSEALYVLTDVRPPSAPIILNLTCDQPNGILYLQWRQPMIYQNSLDQYVLTLRKLPELQPRSRLTLPTNKNDIETTISVTVELWNETKYEVKIYAVTLSVAKQNALINGTESTPEEVSSACVAHSEAMSPGSHMPVDGSSVTALAFLAIALLIILGTLGIALLYWRSRLSKCISAAYNYLEDGGERAARAPLNSYKKPVGCSPLRACSGGDGDNAGGTEAESTATCIAPSRPPRMSSIHHPAVKSTAFPSHVGNLHADGDIGFSKEYEVVVTRSAALGHTSHHSHRPENKMKNRYLNITAYDHSRVCVSAGGRCGAAGCIGAGRGVNCDYVNANFIDGMLSTLDDERKRYIRRRLERRARPVRQPSVKPMKPPPNLAEGIESAFLNIEFSGIVESEEQEADGSDSERSDDDDQLDDVYIDLDGNLTRVKLEWLVWRRRYIATQGPTPATLDAFWRMIWQHRVHTLVMITNLVERGRRKCDLYWPSGGRGSTAEFGGVHITLLHEDVRAAYTVRHLKVKRLEGSDPGSITGSGDGSSNNDSDGRVIVQYHYTVWPDHGTPQHPLAVLPFVKAASIDPNTVLVHCSAGVGRTGTYIVLDAQLNQLKLTGTLSPLGFLCRARTQRNHLVQTEEQYVFVHDALLEHVRSGNTEVEFPKARDYLIKLLEPISVEELAVIEIAGKNKVANDITNGCEPVNGDTCSTKSLVRDEIDSVVSSDVKTVDEMNNCENGSQTSLKTDELSNELNKSVSMKEFNGDSVSQEGKGDVVNGIDENDGVYDLAPRSCDTYNKKMQAYANMTPQEKEECRRINRAENYAVLERMRSLSGKTQPCHGPPPVNLLEKQFQLITRSCVEPGICARANHNLEKNRQGGIVPSDGARVMLVPKPGIEGSEYVNASWVCGRRRLREYAVAQHPTITAVPDLWRLLWDHTAQLVLVLTDPEDTDCDLFWPTEDNPELYLANFRASFVSKELYAGYRKSDRKSEVKSPTVNETLSYRRQESHECADNERLIPDSISPINESEPAYRFDRTELRLEHLNSGTRDLSARKSIANGDLFSSLTESRRSGPKSPRSPSKMSLKNFKLSSPTRFKFPDWGARVSSPPETAPLPPPVLPSLSVEEETELRRPCYTFDKVDSIPNDVTSDRIIEVTNVSVHSLQDDYQLNVQFMQCCYWLDGDTTKYVPGRPDDNILIRNIREAKSNTERDEAIDKMTEPFKDSFALIEFVAGRQMEYKNGPVVVVDKYGGWRAMSFCTLSAACGGVRSTSVSFMDPSAEYRSRSDDTADIYCWAALSAHTRAPTVSHDHSMQAHTHDALLAQYAALARYGPMLQDENR